MPKIPSMLDMLKSGVHFGHLKSKRHPKMDGFIFVTKNDLNIIDLAQTQQYLKKALDYVESVAAKKGTILFVGTKKQAQAIIKKQAEQCGMPFVCNRWLGGTLTNFNVVLKTIKKYKNLKDKQASGELAKYTKKEQLNFSRQIIKLDELIGGIQFLNKLPEAVFILDIKKNKTALQEAKKRNIPVIALCDSNVNPGNVDYMIPANDDAVKSIEMIVSLIAEAVNEGKAKQDKLAEEAEKSL